MTRAEIIQVITGLLGTLGFSVLFNIRKRRLIMSALGGFFSIAAFILLGYVIESEPLRYFIVSAMIAVYAEIVARTLKTPTTTILMTALIPLVPGASLYYTMSYALESDLNKFLEKAIYTLKLAGALALGIVITTMVINILRKKKETSDGSNKNV